MQQLKPEPEQPPLRDGDAAPTSYIALATSCENVDALLKGKESDRPKIANIL